MPKLTFRNRQGELIARYSRLESLLADMQGSKARKAMASAFDATPAQLGKAAAKAARRR